MLVIRLLVTWAVLAVSIGIAAWLLSSVELSGGLLALLGVALIFAVVQAIVGPLLRLVSLPVTIVTFGLFTLVIDGILLAITAGLSKNLAVGGFVGVIVAAFVISVISTVLEYAVDRLMAPRAHAHA